jgi:peptidoglycan/LPS O-acetylase OafA/YrhL
MKANIVIAKTAAFVAAALALLATVSSISVLGEASNETILNEYWRVVGLAVFSALFVLVGFKETTNYRLWEILIASKLVLVILALTILSSVEGSEQLLIWDGLLVLILSTGYIFARRAKTSAPTSKSE